MRVGCDVQDVAVVRDAITTFGTRYLDRVFTHSEQRDAQGSVASLAARFAAKEAVLKLIGEPDGIDPRSIEVRRSRHGRPQVGLTGLAGERATALGLGDIDISISHDAGIALAVAVSGGTHE